jgi:AraC-like DNA-binding protein
MERLVERARTYLDERRGERVTLEELASVVGASPFYLQRRFKEAFGVSPRDYQDAHRVEAVKSSLKNGSRVTDALYEAGYGSVSRFYEKQRLGMSARDYRARGKGQRIGFSTFKCPLGTVLIAATEKGLCSVKLGDDPARLRHLLADEFSEAELTEKGMDQLKEKILAFVEGEEAWRGCRSTSAARCSSAACGTSCAAFRAARRAPTATSPVPSARPRRCARWAAPAAPTRSRSSCPATARCAPTAAWAATPGG